MILTDEEIMDVNQNHEFDSAIGFARTIESAVIKKIKASVPTGWQSPIYGTFHGANYGDTDMIPLYRIED